MPFQYIPKPIPAGSSWSSVAALVVYTTHALRTQHSAMGGVLPTLPPASISSGKVRGTQKEIRSRRDPDLCNISLPHPSP